MCNLYSITTNQEAIIRLFRVINRYVGNLAPMPGVFPGYPAPVIRNTDTGTEMTLMRWGMPPPPRTGGPPVTNIRNTSSPHLAYVAQARKFVVWSRSTASLGMRPTRTPRPRKRTSSGWPSTTIVLSPALRAYGPSSRANVAPSRSRSPARTMSTAFSQHRRTPLSSRSIPRPCRSS
jgi:hypothetical protein